MQENTRRTGRKYNVDMNISQRDDTVDGLAITHLPEGMGGQSDFEFEWGGVSFVQRVWESQIEEGVWRVDLQIQVMRGAKLADPASMRAFLARYHEAGDDWALEPFGDRGFSGEREAFLLLEPRLAAEVRDPFGRQGIAEVKAIAEGLRLLER